jgi:glycosyltransferase involved in cell wall biosynthesis
LKKILHIISGLNNGGAERSLFNLCNSSLKNHFKQIVLCLGKEGIYGYKLEEIGVKVYYIDFKSRKKIIRLIIFLKICKKINPDIIQGWMTHGNFFSLIAFTYLSFKPRLFWNIRQTFYNLKHEVFFTRILLLVSSFFSKVPQKIICNSNLAKRQLSGFGYNSESFVFIPNGFDLDFWKKDTAFRIKTREQVGIKGQGFVIGYVGRFHEMKNINSLLNAFSYLSAKYPNLYLMIIGHDASEYSADMLKFVNSISVDKIKILGSKDDIHKYYSCFDLFVLCSAWGEGFPNVLGEAMSCELCCISTNVGEAPALLQDVGFIIPVDDLDALVSKITNCIENLEMTKNMGILARNKIVKTYSLQNTVNQYINLYNDKIYEN